MTVDGTRLILQELQRLSRAIDTWFDRIEARIEALDARLPR